MHTIDATCMQADFTPTHTIDMYTDTLNLHTDALSLHTEPSTHAHMQDDSMQTPLTHMHAGSVHSTPMHTLDIHAGHCDSHMPVCAHPRCVPLTHTQGTSTRMQDALPCLKHETEAIV
jgi:hypothetical protein